MALKTQNLTPSIGTEILADAQTLLSGGVAAEIRTLLDERGVIVVRDLNLTDEQQLAFAKSLGNVRLSNTRKAQDDDSVPLKTDAPEGIAKITFDAAESPYVAQLLVGTFDWHIDGMWEAVPPLASILTPRVLSSTGGETQFADTYASYEDLSEADKKLFGTLEALHTMTASYRNVIPNPSPTQLKEWNSYPDTVHPLIWQHRSGRKSIAISSSVAGIVGIDAHEGDALLKRLWAWVTQPKYIYQHHWKMGDLVIWNNTGTMHRALHYATDSGRRMHRVTLEGEETLAA